MTLLWFGIAASAFFVGWACGATSARGRTDRRLRDEVERWRAVRDSLRREQRQAGHRSVNIGGEWIYEDEGGD